MQPSQWHPSVALSPQEEQIVQRIRRAKLFVFLRHHRHEVFDESFQRELATLYRPSTRGHPPVAPAQLALAVIFPAYMGVSDDEVIEQPSWIGAGSWCWIVLILSRRRSAKERLSLFGSA